MSETRQVTAAVDPPPDGSEDWGAVPDRNAPAPTPVIPAGWEFLPGGVRREVRVYGEDVPRPNSNPFAIRGDGVLSVFCEEVKVLGPVLMLHDPDREWCGRKGSAWAEADAPILYRRA